MQASENGGMERIIEMHYGPVGTIHYKVVLDQVIGSETEEVDP
jgi:hypothetical protein